MTHERKCKCSDVDGEPWQYRCAGLAHLPGHDDVWRQEAGASGCWKKTKRGRLLKRRLKAGINFFDTADVYSLGESERITGKLLREFQPRREELVIATKVFNPMSDAPNDRGLSRKHIMASIDASLKRLGVDYVDLYQIHRFDKNTPIEETCEALERRGEGRQGAVPGRVQHVCVAVSEDAELPGGERAGAVCDDAEPLQPGVSRGRARDDSAVPRSEDWVHSVEPAGAWVSDGQPQARGRQEGETLRARTDDFGHGLYYRETDFDIVDRVLELAAQRNVKPAQIALAWVLSKPGVCAPIVGASKLYQLEDALGALDVKLTPEEIAGLEQHYEAHPVLGHGY